jgi:hypothetical protein
MFPSDLGLDPNQKAILDFSVALAWQMIAEEHRDLSAPSIPSEHLQPYLLSNCLSNDLQ